VGRDTSSVQSLVPAGRAAAEREVSLAQEELPPLRARGVGEMLDTAVDVIRARFVSCVLLSTALWIPVMAFDRLGSRLSGTAGQVHSALSMLLMLPVQSLTVALVTLIVYGHLQGREVGPGRATMIGLKRAPALLICTIASTLATWFGALLCLVPGIYLAFLWSAASAALVLERLGPIAALARSAQLVRSSFKRWLGLVLVAWCLMLPFTALSGTLTDPRAAAWIRAHTDLSTGAYDVLAAALASRRRRSLRAASSEASRMRLMATARSSRSSCAAYTTPMPPWPSRRVTR